jgi:UrcA family protein
MKEPNMNLRLTFSFVSAALLALVATGLVTKTDPAIAQQVDEEMEEIVVKAPIVRRKIRQATPSIAKIEIIELKRRVSYADLDLNKAADVTELETRIKTSAKDSCERLNDMFPLVKPSGGQEIQRCTDKPVAGTEKQVRAAIAAAS